MYSEGHESTVLTYRDVFRLKGAIKLTVSGKSDANRQRNRCLHSSRYLWCLPESFFGWHLQHLAEPSSVLRDHSPASQTFPSTPWPQMVNGANTVVKTKKLYIFSDGTGRKLLSHFYSGYFFSQLPRASLCNIALRNEHGAVHAFVSV